MNEYNTEIENNDGVKYINMDCIDRNDDFDVKLLNCEGITMKSKIEESSDSNINQKDGNPGALQVQYFPIVLTSFDCKENTKYHKVGLESRMLRNKKVRFFRCGNCDYRTTIKRYLKSHMLRHKADAKVYKCSGCQYKTVYIRSFRRHMLHHRKLSEGEVFTCTECNYQTKFKRNLMSHKVLHTAEIFSCDQCNFQTKHKRYLKYHKRRHRDQSELEETNFYMSNCSTEKNNCVDITEDFDVNLIECENATIKHEIELEYEYKAEKGNEDCIQPEIEDSSPDNKVQEDGDPAAFQVQDFSVVLTSLDTKNTVHLESSSLKTDNPSKNKSKPNMLEPLNKEVGMFTCSQCDYKTKLKYYLKYHALQHKSLSEVEIFSCSNCDYRTKNKRYLSIHKVRHKADAKVYKCSECQYKTVYTNAFHQHMLRHKADAKEYKCSECQYKTVYINKFKLHILRHKKLSEVEVFTCKECNYQTKQKRYLISHQVQHTTEIFSCGQCNFQTKYKHSLKKHKQRHRDPSEPKETTFYMSECDTEIEGNNCVDIKEDFDVNLIECGNATIEHEIESEYEYKVKTENDDRFKPEIGDLSDFSPDNTNHKVGDQGASQVKDSIASSSLDCDDNRKCETVDRGDFENCQSRYRILTAVDKSNMDNDDPSKNRTKPKTHALLNNQFGMFTCSECGYQTNYKPNFQRHNLQHKELSQVEII